eukprot:TRINITY_DN4625_c1_g1_i1.p5 TRINITY_DN4625_c1_g1~~TRINITY_DN4625_c1_g1_i1.p5  ORF type:complete len:112 (+),score=19.64 TRINITY_DN4625_c1_g1_i1:105-440(+)
MQLRNKMKETKGTKFKALREAACKDIKERWGELPPELVLPAFLDLRLKDLDFFISKKEELISILKRMVISEEPESEKSPSLLNKSWKKCLEAVVKQRRKAKMNSKNILKRK